MPELICCQKEGKSGNKKITNWEGIGGNSHWCFKLRINNANAMWANDLIRLCFKKKTERYFYSLLRSSAYNYKISCLIIKWIREPVVA